MSASQLDTFLQMQTELISRLSANGSTFYTTTRIKSALNIAKDRAEAYAEWPGLEDAESTSTEQNINYMDIAERYRSDSVVRLKIDGLKYDKKDYEDFLDYTENEDQTPDPTKRIFANHNRQVFVWPTPTTDGDRNVDMWGITGTPAMTLDGDTTIFTRSDVTGNEAIVKLALSILWAKGKNKSLGRIEEAEALVLLGNIWTKIKNRRQRDQRLQHPRFNVPDMFSNTAQTFNPGNFR